MSSGSCTLFIDEDAAEPRCGACTCPCSLAPAPCAPAAEPSPGQAAHCEPSRPVRSHAAELSQASGLAVSRRVPGRLWTHNDSGQPEFSSRSTPAERSPASCACTGVGGRGLGSHRRRARARPARVCMWPTSATTTPSASASRSIGCRSLRRRHRRVSVHRCLPRHLSRRRARRGGPARHAGRPPVHRDQRRHGTVAVYRFPRELRAGATVSSSESVSRATPGKSGRRTIESPTALYRRTASGWCCARNSALMFYRAAELLAGTGAKRAASIWQAGRAAGRRRCVRRRDAVYLAGEGGGKSQPGTFARLHRARRQIDRDENPGRRRRAGRRGGARQGTARARLRGGHRAPTATPRSSRSRVNDYDLVDPRRPAARASTGSTSVPAASRRRRDGADPDADRARRARPARRGARCRRRRLPAQAVSFSRAARARPRAAPPRAGARRRRADGRRSDASTRAPGASSAAAGRSS